VVGRREIEADDAGRLLLELGVSGGDVALEALGLQPRAVPDAQDRRPAHPDAGRHARCGPVGERRRRPLLPRYADDPRFDRRSQPVVLPPGARRIGEGEDAAVAVALLPLGDEPIRHGECGADGGVAGAVAEQQDAPRAARDPGRRGRRAEQPLEIRAFGVAESESHARSKHARRHRKTDATNISDAVH